MTWGKQLPFLLDMKKDGLDPSALRDRPVLDAAQAYYMSIYRELSDSRRYTYGQPVCIPVSEVLAYCEMYYVHSVTEREVLARMVRVLDGAYLKVTSEQSKQNDEKPPKQ